jgi:hypothetical protein
MITAITRTISKIVPIKPKPIAASIRLLLGQWIADTLARRSSNVVIPRGVVVLELGTPRLEVVI